MAAVQLSTQTKFTGEPYGLQKPLYGNPLVIHKPKTPLDYRIFNLILALTVHEVQIH